MGSQGMELSQTIKQRVEQMKQLCRGLDEATASRAPAERWSPKQIVSHITGPDGVGEMPAVQAFLNQDMPRIDLEAANPFFSERRSRMSMVQLLDEFQAEYDRVAALVESLSDEQYPRLYVPIHRRSSSSKGG